MQLRENLHFVDNRPVSDMSTSTTLVNGLGKLPLFSFNYEPSNRPIIPISRKPKSLVWAQSTRERRNAIWRHKMAVCLWNLRKGIGIERTCSQNGWSDAKVRELVTTHRFYDKARKRTRICKGCGASFTPVGCSEYCTRRCMTRHTAAVCNARYLERIKLIRDNGDQPPLCEITPEIQNLINMHKRGLGTKSIGKLVGMGSSEVRTILLKAGVLRLQPKNLPSSGKKAAENERIAKRKAEKEAAWRHRIAVCLNGLRHGIGVGTTCKENGWVFPSVYNHIKDNRAYIRFKASHPTEFDYLGNQRRLQIRSRKYIKESDFQNAICGALSSAGQGHETEVSLDGIRSRIDVVVGDKAYELKVSGSTQDMATALGQCLLYKSKGYKPTIVIPDDIAVHKECMYLLQEHGIRLLTEYQFVDALAGVNGAAQVLTRDKPRKAFTPFTCKCCGETGNKRSTSKNGHPRSYCVECESKIPNMVFDYTVNRWTERMAVLPI